MTSPSQDLRKRRKTGAVLLTALIAAATPAVAGPADAYYERSLMHRADQRCRLFDAPVSRALEAGVAQARGAALRGGVSETMLDQTRARALTRAAKTDCASADLHTAAERVRGAFDGWARQSRMRWPGEADGWSVDRSAYRTPTWRMRQDADGVTFGFAGAGTGHTLALTAASEGGTALISARVIVRDPSRAGTAWIRQGMVAATPPRSATRSFWAGRQIAAPDGLAGEGARLFRFSTATADALARLDPREHFEIELTHADGSVRSVTMEAGDFAAARAFLAMGTL